MFRSKTTKMIGFIAAGSIAGLALFLIHISNFFSYLSDSPNTCMNCHIMGPEYATWYHSAHREVTTCNDCHVPQHNVLAAYSFKAMDGLRHSYVFTTRTEPQSIIIKKQGVKAVQSNCLRCHLPLFTDLRRIQDHPINYQSNDGELCWRCHRDTPHGRVRSLSSTPFARVPTTESMIPEWLNKMVKQ